MPKIKTHVKRTNFARSRKSPEEIIAQLIKQQFESPANNILVAIGGAGGSGKSTFSRRLSLLLDNAPVLRLDDYKTARKERQSNKLFGAHPKANKLDLIKEHLNYIVLDKSFDKPIYNAVSGDADSTEQFEPKKINIIDGEISCYKELREFNSINIFIDSDWKTQLNTRISRDIDIRKYSKEKAIETFLQSNLKEFTKYGAASKNYADIVIYCNEEYELRIESVAEELFKKFNDILKNDLARVDLSGLIVPVMTPFNEDYSINSRMFIDHLDFLMSNNVRRILVCGTSSEFPSLRTKEKHLLLKLAKEYFSGVVLYQAGNTSLQKSIEDAKWAIDFGVDGILSLPPYYYANADEKGIIEYLETLGNEINIPYILYNFPKHTQNPITENILKSVKHFGMKDSSGTLDLLKHTDKYYVGKDSEVSNSLIKGGYGFIIGNANLFPKLYVEMEQKIIAKDFDGAKEVQLKINESSKVLVGSNKLSKMKAALNIILDDYSNVMRPPLVTIKTEDNFNIGIKKLVTEINQ
ncbi:MAG: dihydrodipicolinate synthase family protein [Melioribacteraceae bacterium]|nr:dihydrodipicolinate synthase family protein [Melioribacteraceae bacterium]